MVLWVSACADPDPDPAEMATATEQADIGAPTSPHTGGDLVLAVEQWPHCINPITSCANSSWLSWSVLVHVLPRLMELDIDNTYRASPTLVEAPTIENGGIVVADDGVFTLTYRLNPDARWSDGTPITSRDVWFTWRAMLDTVGALQTAGYDLIQNVNTDDPQTAVVTFSEPYGAWRELFGVLLPGHVLGPDTNIAEQWNDAITVSGGPWLSQSWSADRHILIPNPNYWVPERRPLVDRVVMVPMESTEAQVTALQSGQVMAALPQPFPGLRDRFTADLTFVLGEGTFVEGFWINQQSPNRRFEITRKLRQAVAYSLDRQRIADAALGPILDQPLVLQCAGWNPSFGDWCGDDFAHYIQDVDKVTELLGAEGWARPDPNGLWVNSDGEELILQFNTVAGNQRREDVQVLVGEMTAPFGIGWEIVNYDPAELFQERLPAMDFGPVALYANDTSPDPSVVKLYAIDGIPNESNGFSGQNFLAYTNPEASDLAFAIDGEVDNNPRLALVRRLAAILAEDVPWIPLYVLPNLLVWNSTMVEGAGAWVSSPYSGFYDIYDWTVISAGQ